MSDNDFHGRNEVAEFFVGMAMLIVGGYFFLENIEVVSGNIFNFSIGGRRMDGLIFVPLIASIIFLFYKYCITAKVCCVFSMLLIVANAIVNLRLYWNATSLFATLVIFILLFGGIGLVSKVLFANPGGKHGKKYR